MTKLTEVTVEVKPDYMRYRVTLGEVVEGTFRLPEASAALLAEDAREKLTRLGYPEPMVAEAARLITEKAKVK